MQLSPHFALAEFASGDGVPTPPSAEMELRSLALGPLEKIRAHFGGRPVEVLSGFRSPAHNAAVGGKPLSQHLWGRAADIRIEGVSPTALGEYAATLPEVGGVGIYHAESFTHVDIRPRLSGPVARWEE